MTVVAGGEEDAQSTSTPNVPHCGEDSSAEWALPFLQMLCSWGGIFHICRETLAFHFWRKPNFCSVSYLKTTVSAEASWKTSTDLQMQSQPFIKHGIFLLLQTVEYTVSLFRSVPIRLPGSAVKPENW